MPGRQWRRKVNQLFIYNWMINAYKNVHVVRWTGLLNDVDTARSDRFIGGIFVGTLNASTASIHVSSSMESCVFCVLPLDLTVSATSFARPKTLPSARWSRKLLGFVELGDSTCMGIMVTASPPHVCRRCELLTLDDDRIVTVLRKSKSVCIFWYFSISSRCCFSSFSRAVICFFIRFTSTASLTTSFTIGLFSIFFARMANLFPIERIPFPNQNFWIEGNCRRFTLMQCLPEGVVRFFKGHQCNCTNDCSHRIATQWILQHPCQFWVTIRYAILTFFT